MATRQRGEDLREACIGEALRIIETSGVEGLSLREVARRLGVSHQAPYKHYPSRDHLLAEIIRREFDAFALALDSRTPGTSAAADLRAMGETYLRYAVAHPLQYRLMFNTPLPDPSAHPAMMTSARHAFDLLRKALTQAGQASDADADALFIWAGLHGLASILQSPTLDTLNLPAAVLEDAVAHLMSRMGAALGHTS